MQEKSSPAMFDCFSDQCRAESFQSTSGSLGVTVCDVSVLRGQRSLPSAGYDGRRGRSQHSQHLPHGHEKSHTPPPESGATEYSELHTANANTTADTANVTDTTAVLVLILALLVLLILLLKLILEIILVLVLLLLIYY